MCGRYAATKHPDQLVEEFEVDAVQADDLPADFNVAPTKNVYAILSRDVSEVGLQRQLRSVRWGLVPSWAKDPAIGAKLINARVETLGQKPAFRRALAVRRCLLPADGYFEWYRSQSRTAGSAGGKQPFYIHSRDGRTLAMAGLYEIWRDPGVDQDDPAGLRWTATVITTAANADVRHIHDRMPLLIPAEGWSRWLDPSLEPPGISDLLEPVTVGLLTAYPVGTAVNRVSNNGPALLDPLPAESDPYAAPSLPSAELSTDVASSSEEVPDPEVLF